jgi:hypothetical protein
MSLGGLDSYSNLAGNAGSGANQALSMLKDPAALSAWLNKATQPLNKKLVSSVQNSTNAGLASAGLSTSPGVARATSEQALAPYFEQNQNNALSELQDSLQLPMQDLTALNEIGDPWAKFLGTI